MTQRFGALLPVAGVLVAYFVLFTCGISGTRASIPGTHVELVGVISSPSVALGSNGIVAADGDDGRIHFMRSNGDEISRSQTKTDGHFAMSGDGEFVVAAGRDNKLHWIDPTTGTETQSAPFAHGSVRSLVLSGNGQLVAIAVVDKELLVIVICNAINGQELCRSEALPTTDKSKSPLAFDPSGRYLVVGGRDSILRYDTRKWGVTKVVFPIFGGAKDSAGSVAKFFRPASRLTQSGGHEFQLTSLAFSSDGSYLLLCADNFVTMLNRRTGLFSSVMQEKLNFVSTGAKTEPEAFWLVTEGGTFKTLNTDLEFASEQETSPNPWGTSSGDRSADGKLYVTGVEGGRVTFTAK